MGRACSVLPGEPHNDAKDTGVLRWPSEPPQRRKPLRKFNASLKICNLSCGREMEAKRRSRPDAQVHQVRPAQGELYFLAGGDSDDLIQEGMIGLYKAVRDFRPDKETSFRSFAELCVTRQIITAIKTATRFKHSPLNTYVSFSHTPAGQESEGDCTLGDALPGPSNHDPSVCVISTEELQSLVFALGTGLSSLESEALTLYLEGNSYEEMAEGLGCDTKTSTTRFSASSGRSSRTRRRVRCSPKR